MKRNFLNIIEVSPETKLSVALVILFVTSAALFSSKGPTEIEENHYLTSRSSIKLERTLLIPGDTKPLVIERALKIRELSKKISRLKQQRRELWAKLSRVTQEDTQKAENLEAFEAVESLSEEISMLSGKMINDLKEVRAHES